MAVIAGTRFSGVQRRSRSTVSPRSSSSTATARFPPPLVQRDSGRDNRERYILHVRLHRQAVMTQDGVFGSGAGQIRIEGLTKTIRAMSRAGADAQDMRDLMHRIGMQVVDALTPPSAQDASPDTPCRKRKKRNQ